MSLPIAMANAYSPTWFDTFLLGASPVSTGDEIDFLTRNLPLRDYRLVLDLCCGTGRHSLAMADFGYIMTGLDASSYALETARKHDIGGKIEFVQGDMRDLSPLRGQFDVVLNLWQSLGYFNEEENKEVLRQICAKLRQGGRFVLDIYNRDFFKANQGTRVLESGSRRVVETKYMTGDRLTVHLDYGPSAQHDTYEWQLYTPDDICAVSEKIGFRTVITCSDFDERKPHTTSTPRMQFVFEKG
ncbi:MAG: class I SAM-dependent methyltransferase [Chloroflexia bacterium]